MRKIIIFTFICILSVLTACNNSGDDIPKTLDVELRTEATTLSTVKSRFQEATTVLATENDSEKQVYYDKSLVAHQRKLVEEFLKELYTVSDKDREAYLKLLEEALEDTGAVSVTEGENTVLERPALESYRSYLDSIYAPYAEENILDAMAANSTATQVVRAEVDHKITTRFGHSEVEYVALNDYFSYTVYPELFMAVREMTS